MYWDYLVKGYNGYKLPYPKLIKVVFRFRRWCKLRRRMDHIGQRCHACDIRLGHLQLRRSGERSEFHIARMISIRKHNFGIADSLFEKYKKEFC